MKRKWFKRALAFSLAAMMTFTSSVPMQQKPVLVQAASVYENANLLVNPDFDGSEAFQPANTTSHAGNWFSWNGSEKTQEQHHSGTTSAKLSQDGASLEQDVPGLVEGMTYELKVWAKLSGTGGSHYIGVKNYGGAEIKQKVDSTDWKEYTIEFTYSGNVDARVFGWVEAAGGVNFYLDDASLVAKGDIQRVSVENGQVQVTFSEEYKGDISKDLFAAVYKSSADAETLYDIKFIAEKVEGNTLTLSYDAIKALPVLQTITFNLTYKGTGEIAGRTFNLDYVIEASGEDVVGADIASVTAANGEITILLSQNPTIKPGVQDFVWEYKIGDGEYKTLDIEEFSYAEAAKTITAAFSPLRGLPQGDSAVTVKVTYGTSVASAEFILTQSASRTIYVSAEGNDSNAGTSEDAPIQTIAKLNTMTFYPGDQILFRKGDTFTGCFKPMGSGTEEYPITVGAYGEGAKPVLQPGEDFTVPFLMSAGEVVTNPTVNYVIWFYNVEYWEVSDLELKDPKDAETYQNPGNVYRSGITIQAKDAGTLEHIYVDNMVIHGFHGPHTNIGKSSGGITMNVITDFVPNGNKIGQRTENSVPTQINDIRITNCEIYNVGRSGINFLTPWAFRSEEKWGPFNYGDSDFAYLPYEDFYMGNNYIHDIDGDGTIIDNCADAVSEYNLVTRCVKNTNGAAVGMFNWNSDRTTFQYNEVFDIRYGTNDSYHLNDSQGIEIDALNDGTLVQYNYVHDNTGGFMMLCNIADQYRSFDGIIRYNISQNDYAHPRQGLFDIYEANWGTEVYNNNFYLTERALSTSGYGSHVNAGELFLFSAVGSRDTMKFYNNIFYYAGETPATVNTFGDDVIDWQSNIFYNFTNMPVDDNVKAPNLAVDPMWNNPGAGGDGTYAAGKENLGYQTDLSCYYLKEGSPALNAGVQVENNGGKDYFGNPVEGLVDIGAYETGSVAVKVVSGEYAVDQNAKSITINSTQITVKEFLENLVSEKEVTVAVKRNGAALTDGTAVEAGDTVTVSLGEEAVIYTVRIIREYDSAILAKNAKANSEQWPAGYTNDGKAAWAFDDEDHWWHSRYQNWDQKAAHEVGSKSGDGVPSEDNPIWIQTGFDKAWYVSAIKYTGRTGQNGYLIKDYTISVANLADSKAEPTDADFKEVKAGTLSNVAIGATQTITLDEPVLATHVRITVKSTYAGSGSGEVTAKKISIWGYDINEDNKDNEDVVKTENLNHVRKATMTRSSVEDPKFEVKNVNDGDTSTRWSSASATVDKPAEWIQAEFEELTQIKHVKVKFHTRASVDIKPNNVSKFTIKYIDKDGNEQTAKADCTLAASGDGYVTEASIVLDNAVVAKAIKLCDFNVKRGTTIYNSIGITELEAYSNEIEAGAIVDLAGLVESLEGIQNGVIENGTFTLPEVPERFTIKLNGADFEQILGKDGTVVQPLTDKEIKVSYEVSDGIDTKVTNDITYLVKGKNAQVAGKNAKPVIIPEIQEWYSESTEKLAASALTKVTYNKDSLAAVVDEFIADYEDFTGVKLTKVKGEAQAGAFNFTMAAPDVLLGEEGYTMEILADRINVASESITGNMYGMQTILQMSKADATGFAIGQMRDYPRFEVRGFMLDIARKPVGMEMVNEIARTMRYYKMNDFQLHLSDNYIWLENYGVGETENESFKAYEAFRLESDVTNEKGESPTAKDYFITKDEMRTFIQSQRALGMNIVPEIDLPAHATSFTKIWPELMVQGASKNGRPLVDHFDITKPEAVEQIKKIFDDYTTGENPTFDSETVVHVGADEFEYNKTSYREFFNTIVPHVKQTNPQVRIWGSLSTINDGKTQISAEAIENVAMNIWNNGWANGAEMYKLGFKLINTLDGPNYMVPNGGMGRGAYGDLLNHDAVFNFDPNVYGGQSLPTSDDQILGSVYAIWNDNIDKNASGLTESDLYWRFFDSLPLYAEKNWAATGREKGSASAVIGLAQTFGTGPRTNPYYQEEADTNGIHESYDFTNGMEDASANDRDLRIGTAKVADGVLNLNGGNSYVTTPIDKLGNGNELSFDITLTEIPKAGDILFETTPEYGTHDIRIMENGRLGFTRELYNYYFDYELPVGKNVNIRIVVEQQDTTLYVDGVLIGEAVGKFIHNGMEKKTGISHSTFALPLERIGSKTNAVAAVIDNVVVREKVEEAPAVDLYNKPAWTGSTNSETIYDANEGKLIYAFDGKPGTIWHSNWQGSTDKLTDGRTYYAEIDFGQAYEINQFSFTPRTPQDSGRVTKADLYIKENASDEWKQVGKDVTFAADASKKTFYFEEQAVRYAKFVAKESSDGWVAISEFDIANAPEPKLTVYLETTEGGTVTGAAEVSRGANVTLTATADTGYRFDGWYDVSGTKVSDAEVYTFTVQKNTALVAKFALANMGPNGAGAELLGYTLSLEGNIGVNFYLKLNDAVLSDNGAYMNFNLNGSEQKIYVKDAVPTTQNDVECYEFKCSVPVKDMDTEIEAQIVLSDGSKGAKHTYTIENYADYIRENEEEYSEKVIELVEAMSNFGDYAATYFAEETIEEVPEEMLAVTTETLKEYQAAIPEDKDDIYYGSSLSLKSETILRHYFTEEVEGSVKKGDLYYIERTGIPAHKLGENITMTVNTSKGAMEITYSPLSYAYIALGLEDSDENLASLMRAMYLYYQAAQAYAKAE